MITRVGFLISYDYEYLKHSLPLVYTSRVESIVLALDKERLTWSGNKIEIPQSFFDWIKEFDTENKISIYEDSFYKEELSPIQCDTRERNLLLKQMGEADWYLQIDTDEYLIDFEKILDNLQKIYDDKELYNKPTVVCAKWLTIFKKTEQGLFLIAPIWENCSFAINKPTYKHCRTNADFKQITLDEIILHQSFGRTPDEVATKLSNWGHAKDFNTESFFNMWKIIDENNYMYIQNFHPLDGVGWKKLKFMPITAISDMIRMNSAQFYKLFKEDQASTTKRSFIQKVAKKIFKL